MTTGEKIRMLRENLQMSQEQFAEEVQAFTRGKVKISRTDISNWELDRTVPRWDKAKVLVKYLGITLDELAFDDIRISVIRKRTPMKIDY